MGNMKEGIEVERPNISVDGVVTARLKNGKWYTYKIETVTRWPLQGKRIVSLLTGPDNTAAWKGFAFVSHDLVWVWKKYCQWNGSSSFQKHAQILNGLANDHVQQFMQAGRCRRCGRLLTTPVSIERGIGPECFKKEGN